MSRMFLKVFSFISTMTSPARVAALIRCRCRVYAQESGYISCDSDSLHRPCIFHFLLRLVVICITHLTVRRHFTFHQQRFNLSYPSRQFSIPLKVTIALEIFTHNKPYFIDCRKKKLLAFPDLDSINFFTCLWRNYPIFGYFKSSCHF
jgi:hypothetical protein